MQKNLVLLCCVFVAAAAAISASRLRTYVSAGPQENAAIAEVSSALENSTSVSVCTPVSREHFAAVKPPSAAERMARVMAELREIARMEADADYAEVLKGKDKSRLANYNASYAAKSLVQMEVEIDRSLQPWPIDSLDLVDGVAIVQVVKCVLMLDGISLNQVVNDYLEVGPPAEEDEEKEEEMTLNGVVGILQRLEVTGYNPNTKAARKVIAAIRVLRRDLKARNDDTPTAEEEKTADEIVKASVESIESIYARGFRPDSGGASKLAEALQILKEDQEVTTRD